jgi:hypothetical protein
MAKDILKAQIEPKEWASLLFRLIAVLALLGGGAAAYGSLQSKVNYHSEAIPDHERRIRTLETELSVEQRLAQERHEAVMRALEEVKQAVRTHIDKDTPTRKASK